MSRFVVFLFLTMLAACGDAGREPGLGFCSTCIGINTAPPDEPPDRVGLCVMSSTAFQCTCTTESGSTETLMLTPIGCEF